MASRLSEIRDMPTWHANRDDAKHLVRQAKSRLNSIDVAEIEAAPLLSLFVACKALLDALDDVKRQAETRALVIPGEAVRRG